ncbi:MAG TPA: hypothetical protein VGL77_20360, partial [Armatimonadota bacterium]
MEVYQLLAALVLLPALSSVLSLTIKQKSFRNALILLTTLVMVAASLVLASSVIHQGGHLTFTPDEATLHTIGWVIKIFDLVVLG